MSSEPMRLLIVSQEVPPETGWGGIGTYVGILAPALAGLGHDVHLLSVVAGQAESTTEPQPGVTVHRRALRRLRGVGRATRLTEAWGRLSLARAVAAAVHDLSTEYGPFDVLESPNWNAEGLFVATRNRMPVVVRLHSWAGQIFSHFSPRRFDARLAVRLEERLVRHADVVIGTQVQIDDAADRLGIAADALRVIPPPVPIVDDLTEPSEPPSILFVGRLEARKGPETVVRAFGEIARSVPDARLTVVGRDSTAAGIPSYAEWLRGLAAALGVADRVVIDDGRPDDAAVAELRRRATVCVMPSRWESFGYVAAEGLAAGRPVVASDVGGLREVVDHGETGYLVAPDDVASWATALTNVLTERTKAREFGRLGARRMRERYSPARIADLTVDAYRAAAHSSGRAQRVLEGV